MSGADWSGGYLNEETYTTAFQRTQEPSLMQVIALLHGVAWTVPREGMVFVDVGCGRGYTTCLLAAANPSWTVIGLDYMPAQIAEARQLAAESGISNVTFHEVDLSQLGPAEAARLVPEADVVTLHGIWSWVSDAVQDGILEVLNRLKPGGAALVSYNALPGWSDGLGMQRLVHLLGATGPGRPQERVKTALDVVKRLLEAEAKSFQNAIHVKALVGQAAEQGPALTYVAHEMLNEHWRAYFAPEVWRRMARAKLDFIGSATITENFLPFQLTDDQRAIVDALPAGAARELAIDIVANRQFRRDIYIRGKRPMVPIGAWRNIRFVRCTERPMEAVKFNIPVGTAEVPAATMTAVIDALDAGPMSFAEILTVPEASRMSPWELAPVLLGTSFARVLWRDDPGPDSAAMAAARRFTIAAGRRYAADDKVNASLGIPIPCLGGGLEAHATEVAVAGALLSAQQETPDAPLPNEVVLTRALLRPEAPTEAIMAAEGSIRDILRDRVPVWRRLGLLR